MAAALLVVGTLFGCEQSQEEGVPTSRPAQPDDSASSTLMGAGEGRDSLLPPAGPTVIGDEACEACIRLEHLVRLGSLDGADAFGEDFSSAFAVASNGDIYHGSFYTEGVIRRFDASGEFLHEMGGTGDGPGELHQVTELHIGAGDTVYAIDGLSRILNRFTHDGTYLDRTLLPGGFVEILPLEGRKLLLAGQLRTRESIGFPLHVSDENGIVLSFGEELDDVTPQSAGQLVRYVAKGRQGFWSAERLTYSLRYWSAPGELRATLQRDAAWFPGSDIGSIPAPMRAPPAPQIHALWDGGDGYLWVFALVADPQWRPGRLEYDSLTGMDMVRETSMNPFFDSVIEVIDISNGVAVARLQDDRVLRPVGYGPTVYSYEEDLRGVPYYHFWRVRIDNLN